MATQRNRFTLTGLVAAVVVVMGGFMLAACGDDGSATGTKGSTTSLPTSSAPTTSTTPREPVTHDFVIPSGTAEKLARGEDVDVIPATLEVHVGDRIQVSNDDSELARLGIFDVRPGETVSMNFNTPGQMEGVIFSDDSGGCGKPPADAKTFTITIRP